MNELNTHRLKCRYRALQMNDVCMYIVYIQIYIPYIPVCAIVKVFLFIHKRKDENNFKPKNHITNEKKKNKEKKS